MEIIEQIGAYAGLAAVVGLAVLAALYFSQARDVKRLREWAGRAPERGVMPGAPPPPHQRVVAPPQRTVPHKVPSPAAAVAQGTAGPGGGPVRPGAPTPPPAGPPRAAAPGAAPPAVIGPATATPAAARVAGEEGGRAPAAESQGGVSQDTMMHPPPSPTGAMEVDEERHADEPEDDEPRAERELIDEDEAAEDDRLDDEQLHDEDVEYEDDLDDGAVDGQDTEDSPALAQPPPPAPRPSIPPPPPRPVPRPSQGPILPPYEKNRPGGGPPWYRRGLASRGGALVIGATVFVIALVVVALGQFGGDDPKQPTQEPAESANVGSGDGGKGAARSGVVPAKVTVSVLNGTTVGGLAAELGDKLQGQGFRLGNVTNSTDQQRAESVVLFAPGAEREAAEVGRRLKIDQREPIDPESQTLAGDAGVVVITGEDLTQ